MAQVHCLSSGVGKSELRKGTQVTSQTVSHSPSPDRAVVTGAKGCMTVCNSVNNVNNFPLSSRLAYSVGFVSNYIQEASMWFKPLWRENGSLGNY